MQPKIETDSRPIKVGVLMYTYNRPDDARINMEIIRNEWKKVPLLKDVIIVRSFNGDEAWWPEKFLEDELCRTENPGHFAGAELLINTGMQVFAEKYPYVTHVILLASDTWCVKPEYLAGVITAMRTEQTYLATSAWGSKRDPNMFNIGMSLDFSIIDTIFAQTYGLFPLRYAEFVERYGEIFSYQGGLVYPERVFALRFKQAIARAVQLPSEQVINQVALAHIHHVTEREPIHHEIKKGKKTIGVRKMYWPKMGLITHHDPFEKRKALEKWKLTLGEHGKKFMKAKSLSYFNYGLIKNTVQKGKKKIGYNE